jgi:hypothetical protein
MNKPNPLHSPITFIPRATAGLVLVLSLALGSEAALAAPIINVQISETGCTLACTTVTLTDNGSGYLTAASFTVGDYKLSNFIVGGLSQSGDWDGSSGTTLLESSGLITRNSAAGAGALTIAITETGLVAQNAPAINGDLSISETMAKTSTLSAAGYLDAVDAAFGTGTNKVLALIGSGSPGVTTSYPGGGVIGFHNGASSAKSAAADSGGVPFVMSPAGDFSITESITINLSSNNTVTNIEGQFSSETPIYAPEPATLLVLGSGLLGLRLARSRRRQPEL